MRFSGRSNERLEYRLPVTAVVREAQGSARGYGWPAQPGQHATGDYNYSQNSGVNGSYAQPGFSYAPPAGDHRTICGQERARQPSQHPNYSQPHPQTYQHHAQQYPQHYNQRQGQHYQPYRPEPPEQVSMQSVPVLRPRVAPGYAQERHQSVHGEVVYEQPRPMGPAPTTYPSGSQREMAIHRRPIGLKPQSRPMNPDVTSETSLLKSRPGGLVRRDSNGVSEFGSDDDDYRVDLRDYTVSPDIVRGRYNGRRRQ
ncbi:hypothetical protein F4781DRAFT_300710 [Annulohypoxylon bovei var. microspora]|nr:hypothetical protein F4781DRAFT_300710 [Annulohypoxylon bovei var. microspora]